MKQIKVGLIGFGMAGRLFHGPTITSTNGLSLFKVRETKAPNIAIIKERYPDTIIVNDTNAILNDPSIELVIVATPNVTHHEVGTQALMGDKHVIVGKLFTVTYAQAPRLERMLL